MGTISQPKYLELAVDYSVCMKVYMQLADDVIADTESYIQFTTGTTKLSKIYTKWLTPVTYNEESCYVFCCPVPFENFASDIAFTLYTKNKGVGTWTFKVQDYAERIITQTTDDKIVALLKAILNDGAYFQLNFKYNIDNLPNVNLSTEDQNDVANVSFAMVESLANQIYNSIDGLSSPSSAIQQRTEYFELWIYLNLSSDVDVQSYHFSLEDGTTLPVIYKTHNSKYGFSLHIPYSAFDKFNQIYCNGVLWGGVSPLGYIRSLLKIESSRPVDEVNYVKSLYLLHVAAKDCLSA